MKPITANQESRLHYDPLIIGDIRILFSDYDTENATCLMHFDCDTPIRFPVSTYREARRQLNAIAKNGDIDVCFAFTTDGRAQRFAELLGWKVFAFSRGKAYLSRTFKEGNDHGNESRETGQA